MGSNPTSGTNSVFRTLILNTFFVFIGRLVYAIYDALAGVNTGMIGGYFQEGCWLKVLSSGRTGLDRYCNERYNQTKQHFC